MRRRVDKGLARLGTRVGVATVLAWTLAVAWQMMAEGSGGRALSALFAVLLGGVILFFVASRLTQSLGSALRGRAGRPGQE